MISDLPAERQDPFEREERLLQEGMVGKSGIHGRDEGFCQRKRTGISVIGSIAAR